jgi:tetratricopeptide (TPR) repeat protein
MPYSPLTSVVCLPLECYGCNWQCRYQRVHCVRDVLPEVFSEAIQVTLERPSNKPRVFVQGESLWSPNINQPKWQWFDRYLDINLVEIHPVGEVPAMNRAGSRNNPIDSDTPEELNAHAEKIFQRGDREEAKKVLVDLTGRWPTYAKALNNLGVIYRDEGSNQEAEEYFSRAFEVAPRDKNIVLNAGKMLISQKQYEIVKQLYRLFLENNPQAEEIREALEILEKTQA